MTIHDFHLAEVAFPDGYSIDGKGEKRLRMDGSPEYDMVTKRDFDELLAYIEYEYGKDIFALFPIKLDPFGESKIQLALRDKEVMAITDNGDLVEPDELDSVNEEFARRAQKSEDDED